MPLYEYRCKACGKTMELLLSNSKDSPACKYCGGKDMTKLMSPFSTSGESKTGGDFPTCPTGTCNLPRG